jgi:hypothetical protein
MTPTAVSDEASAREEAGARTTDGTTDGTAALEGADILARVCAGGSNLSVLIGSSFTADADRVTCPEASRFAPQVQEDVPLAEYRPHFLQKTIEVSFPLSSAFIG